MPKRPSKDRHVGNRRAPTTRAAAGIATTLVGLTLLALSFGAPADWLRSSGWAEEQAVAYQQASSDLHRLSLVAGSDPEKQQQLRQARVEFADLETQRAAVERSAASTRGLLRWGGVAIAVIGALVARGR